MRPKILLILARKRVKFMPEVGQFNSGICESETHF